MNRRVGSRCLETKTHTLCLRYVFTFLKAWLSTALINHNSDFCWICQRAVVRIAFFKIWSYFSRQNKYGFDFCVITEAVVCSWFYVLLWHLKTSEESLPPFPRNSASWNEMSPGTVTWNENFKGSPLALPRKQVQVDSRKLFPCFLARSLHWLSFELAGPCVTTVMIKSHSKSQSFHLWVSDALAF